MSLSASAKRIQARNARGGSVKQQVLREKDAEIAALREELQLVRGNTDLTVWEQLASQEMRDTFAARALYYERGNVAAALKWLGFSFNPDSNREIKDLSDRVFMTAGVKAFLSRSFKSVDENWEAILSRLTEIAITGDDEQCVRAATTLAKVTGRSKSEVNLTKNVTIYSLIGPPQTAVNGQGTETKALPPGVTHEARFLDYEPGEATRIADDALDAAFHE